MQHSLRGYLEGQSTEKLEQILHYCLDQKRLRDHEDTIRMVWEIILDRDKKIPVEITPQVQAAWEKYLSYDEITEA